MPPLILTTNRANAELLSREKENDARLANARKSLDAATQRSGKMREQFEDKAKRNRLEIKRLTKQVEQLQAEATSVRKEELEKHALALSNALAEQALKFKSVKNDLIEKLKLTKAECDELKQKTPAGYDAMVRRCEEFRAQVEEAKTAKENAEQAAKKSEELLTQARVEMAEAVTSASASSDYQCEKLKQEHAEVLKQIELRVRQTTDALRNERDTFKRQLFESRERESAMSRVLTEQARGLLLESE